MPRIIIPPEKLKMVAHVNGVLPIVSCRKLAKFGDINAKNKLIEFLIAATWAACLGKTSMVLVFEPAASKIPIEEDQTKNS